jgi:hypothetical protein
MTIRHGVNHDYEPSFNSKNQRTESVVRSGSIEPWGRSRRDCGRVREDVAMSVESLPAREHETSAVADPLANPQPACSIANADYLEWRETPYTASLADFHPPCENPACFPDGVPEPDAFESVVRSQHFPTVFHRPRDGCDRHPPSADRVPDGDPEPIESITALRPGDGVVWGASQLPLVVVSATSDPRGTVALRGPNGGEYELEGRSENTYAVDRGYGCVSGVHRIPSDIESPHTADSALTRWSQ